MCHRTVYVSTECSRSKPHSTPQTAEPIRCKKYCNKAIVAHRKRFGYCKSSASSDGRKLQIHPEDEVMWLQHYSDNHSCTEKRDQSGKIIIERRILTRSGPCRQCVEEANVAKMPKPFNLPNNDLPPMLMREQGPPIPICSYEIEKSRSIWASNYTALTSSQRHPLFADLTQQSERTHQLFHLYDDDFSHHRFTEANNSASPNQIPRVRQPLLYHDDSLSHSRFGEASSWDKRAPHSSTQRNHMRSRMEREIRPEDSISQVSGPSRCPEPTYQNARRIFPSDEQRSIRYVEDYTSLANSQTASRHRPNVMESRHRGETTNRHRLQSVGADTIDWIIDMHLNEDESRKPHRVRSMGKGSVYDVQRPLKAI
jgi:hypothetical protein